MGKNVLRSTLSELFNPVALRVVTIVLGYTTLVASVRLALEPTKWLYFVPFVVCLPAIVIVLERYIRRRVAREDEMWEERWGKAVGE